MKIIPYPFKEICLEKVPKGKLKRLIYEFTISNNSICEVKDTNYSSVSRGLTSFRKTIEQMGLEDSIFVFYDKKCYLCKYCYPQEYPSI